MPAPIVPAPATPSYSSATPELRAALLDERRHALEAVLGGHGQLVQPPLVGDPRRQRGLVGGLHGLLAEAHRDRSPAGDDLRELHGRLEPALLDLVDEPHRERLLRA